MYKGKKILGFIPARGGSKGIPHKNLYPLAGKPLIQYTIDAAKACPFLDGLYCSTNDAEIASECTKYNCDVINRPEKYALDTSPLIDAVIHTLDVLKERSEHYDYLLTLQPTSPLRTTEQINGIIQHTIDNDLSSAISVHKIPFNPILMRQMNKDGGLKNCLSTCSTVRRQDMADTFYVNGSLYLIKTDLITPETSLNDIPNGYEINPNQSIDINILSDIIECQSFLDNLKK